MGSPPCPIGCPRGLTVDLKLNIKLDGSFDGQVFEGSGQIGAGPLVRF